MEEGRKHIDDLFREGLEGYREMPDAAVWTSIEQRLPKRGGRRSFLWLWILLMLALLSSLGYYAKRDYFMDDPAQVNRESDIPGSGTYNSVAANKAESISPTQADSVQETQETDEDEKEETKNESSLATTENELLTSKSPTPNRGNRNAPVNQQMIKANEPTQNNNTINGSDDKAIAVSRTSKAIKKKNHADDKEKRESINGINNERTNEQKLNKEDQKDIGAPEHNLKGSATSLPSIINTTVAADAKQTPSLKDKPLKSAAGNKITNPVEKDKNSQPLKPKDKKLTPTSNPTAATSQNPALQPGGKTKEPISNEKALTKANPVTATENAKKNSYPTTADASREKPVEVQHEKSGALPIAVAKEEAKAAPISVQAEPNEKKSKIEVSHQDAKGNPMTAEPAKEYGIKMDEVIQDNVDDKETANSESGGTEGNGTGGAGEAKKKNILKIDGGIKLGHDRGFSDVTTSNFTGNLFLQWNISPRTSLLLQPGLRYHSVNKTSLFPKDSYHQITSESLDSAHVMSDSFGTPLIQRNYIYQNSYDSISMTYAINPQKYIEIELPLLLQYKLAENFSVFGGMQLAFGKIIEIQGSRQNFQGSKLDTFSLPITPFDSFTAPPDRPALSGYFNYSTPEISELDENKYKNPITNPARFGAMLGFSYEYKKRLLIDLLVRKNLSNLNYIPNEQVRKIYSQPYFRITVGYKLFQSK